MTRAGTWCLLLLVLVVTSAAPAAAQPANDPDLALEVEIGAGGYYRPGEWAPVWVRVKNRGADFTGRLVVLPGVPDGDPDRCERPVELPHNSVKDYWMYVQPPETGTVRVGVETEGRGRWLNSPVALPPRVTAVGLIDGTAEGEGAAHGLLASLRAGIPEAEVFPLQPERLPDRWFGYEGFWAVVVGRADAQVFARPEQAEAFAAWVRSGGRAVVVAAAGADPVRGTVLESLLPAGLGPMGDVQPTGGVARWLTAIGAEARPFTVSTVQELRGRTLLGWGGAKLMIRGRFGLGEVILLTFDPARPPFRSWGGFEYLWKLLYRTDEDRDGRWDDSWRDQVQAELESFPVAAPLQLSWLAGILVAYALLVGPVNWLAVRRARRLGWVAGSILFWIALFGAAVYRLGMGSRGRHQSLRLATVLDVVEADGWTRGETTAALYSPQARGYDLAGTGRDHLVTPAVAAWRRWDARGPGRRGGRFDEEDTIALRSFWMPSGSMQFFRTTWCEAREQGAPILVSVTGNRVTVKNRSTVPLRRLLLVAANRFWGDTGELRPGEERTGDWLEQRQHISLADSSLFDARDSSAGQPSWDATAASVSNVIYEASLASELPGRMDLRWREGDNERIPRWLAGGGKILLATLPHAPPSLRVLGESPETLDVCVLRLFIK